MVGNKLDVGVTQVYWGAETWGQKQLPLLVLDPQAATT